MTRPRRLEDDSASYMLSVMPLIEQAKNAIADSDERETVEGAIKNIVIEVKRQVGA